MQVSDITGGFTGSQLEKWRGTNPTKESQLELLQMVNNQAVSIEIMSYRHYIGYHKYLQRRELFSLLF